MVLELKKCLYLSLRLNSVEQQLRINTLLSSKGYVELLEIIIQSVNNFFLYLKTKFNYDTYSYLRLNEIPPYKYVIQSTLVISKSKGLLEIIRDLRTSTYQTCRTEEKIDRKAIFYT